MALLRTDDPDLAVIQRRSFCHFASTTERTQQLPSPEVGTVSFIPPATFQFWNGTTWVKFPPP